MRYKLDLISSTRKATLAGHLLRAGVDPAGIDIMTRKAETVVIRIRGLSAAAANIIKQQMLSIGGDAAVHREVIHGRPDESCAYLISDGKRLEVLADNLERQPFGLAEAGAEIIRLLELRSSPPSSVGLPGGRLDLTACPLIMGVLNVTPDSFSDGGRFTDPSRAADHASRMAGDGASIIDIGGESSRPGSSELDPSEELDRVGPVLERMSGLSGTVISIDTRHSAVAMEAIRLGASIINDISGLTHDPGMIEVAAGSGAAVVVMHMKGTPETMQDGPEYDDAPDEISGWLEAAADRLVGNGISRDKIIVDPGIGFGKRLHDNLEIIDRIGDFHTLGYPVLAGYSRKSFIGTITGRDDPEERLSGGLAVAGLCLDAGVQILRVHDVRETADYVRVWKAIVRKGGSS
jgi:dihydropteroate synthase